MPISGARYRFTTRGGEKVRLAFKGGKVVEAKSFKGPNKGKVHTTAEFAADRQKRKKLPTHGSGELTPLGQRTLAGYQDKWGDSGHAKFEAACRDGLISREKMFKNPEKAKV